MTGTVQSKAHTNQHRSQSSRYAASCLFLVILLSAVCPLCFTEKSLAAETETVITSDTLEYFHDTNKYVARGSVQIAKEDAFVTADEITYDENTGDVVAQGKVDYHDASNSMKGKKAELNLETKTGKIYGADIFNEKHKLHISGAEIDKNGEDSYFSPEAVFTTCDAPLPAWCFKAKNIDTVTGGTLKATDGTFRIRNVPVLYTPYLWTPVLTTRETGFLLPTAHNSNTRGFGLTIPFFWAISENRDATFVLDTFSKKGIGEGLEYRFVEPGEVKGSWWVYHIRDTELDRDFLEVNGLYENRSAGALGGFLNVHTVNEKDYYRIFSPHLEESAQRFLESTGELNFSFVNSRLYLLSQYWIDLKPDAGPVPQKLPEAGYVLNYTKLGSSLVSASITAANIWRDNGLSAERMDFYPKLLQSFGKDFVVSQTAAVRATSYSFYKDNDDPQDSSGILRTAFEYEIVGHTRLYKKYGSLLHVIEPSVGYHLITSSENNLPLLDASELFKNTSRFDFSLLNRIIISGNEVATARITQEIETYNNGGRSFLPLKLELATNKVVPIRLDATYNVYTGRIETLNSDLSMNVFKTTLTFGQSYNRLEDIMFFKAGLEFSPYQRVRFNSSIWYDAKGGGVRNMSIAIRYQRQCWGLRLEMIKKPGDFSTVLTFDLAGMSGEPSKTD